MTDTARTIGRTMLLTFADGRKLLSVSIEIDCPSCGTSKFAVAGEHIGTVIDILTAARDAHPEYCQRAGTITDRTEFAGAVTPPEKARLN